MNCPLVDNWWKTLRHLTVLRQQTVSLPLELLCGILKPKLWISLNYFGNGDPQESVLNLSGPYFTWYIWTHALEITDWHRHRRHFEFWFWPNEKVTRIFKSALHSNKAISEINQWIQVNNFYIHIMISIFTFYPKYVIS